MSDVKAGLSKAKPSREQKTAAAAERRRRKAEELRERRSAKLQAAEPVVRRAKEGLRAVQERIRRRETLADHLQTFYGEVDKLAKGNRQLEATDLTVEHANAIIRDAKAVVAGDVYLDRIREFVPAGENPVYPDVLMVAATVQAAVRRAESPLAEEEKRLDEMWQNARTIAAAARLILEGGDEPPLRADVEDALGTKSAAQWFYQADDDGEYFDVDRFDAAETETLFPAATEE